MPNKNGSFKDHLMLNISTCLRIYNLNVEGISKAKYEILSKSIINNNENHFHSGDTHN